MGELKDEHEKKVKPFVLTATEYLPLLESVAWKSDNNQLDTSLKRLFKREKIEIKIIKKESDANTKFELFQRLNTGGSQLSDQEVRNCLLIMLNAEFYKIFVDLSKDKNFNEIIGITDRLYEERYEMELILRLLSLGNSSERELKSILDVSEFLTAKIKEFAVKDIDWGDEKLFLSETFRILNTTLGDNSFKRKNKDVYKGGFQLTIFEIIATGVYLYVKNGRDKSALPSLIKQTSSDLVSNKVFQKYSGSGSKANYRWPKFVPLLKEIFLDENKKQREFT